MKALALTKNTVDIDLVEGRYYNIEPAETGTRAQDNAFHALVQEYFNSGCFSYEAKNWLELKDRVKEFLGVGYEWLYWTTDPEFVTSRVKPQKENVAFYNGRFLIKKKLVSWARYTKKERMRTMDSLIAEMHIAGVQTKKFEEILRGMGDIWNEKNKPA